MALTDAVNTLHWPPALLADLTKTQIVVRAVLLYLAVRIARTLYNGLSIRLTFRKLRSQGIVIPQPYSPFLGHLPLFVAIRRKYIKNAKTTSSFFLRFLSLHWEDYFPGLASPPEVIYLDLWPLVGEPIAIVNDAAMCQAVVAERTPVRHEQVKILSRAIATDRNLFEWDGPAHRVWRTRLNPGFSMKNLLAHVAMGRVVDEVCIFAEGIKDLAAPAPEKEKEAEEEKEEEDGTAAASSHQQQQQQWGEVFQMFPRAVALTFDIICSVALDFSPGEQLHGPTNLQIAFDILRERHLVFKHLATLPRRLNPFWHWEHYRCHRTISQILLPHLQRSLPQNNPKTQSSSSSSSGDSKSKSSSLSTSTSKRPKTVIDLALTELNQESPPTVPSKDFIEDVIGLIKQFIFAGHDTTAITLSFAYHFLTRHPDAMRRLREEHDEVFGKGEVEKTPEKLRQAPHLINSLPFTTAVLKETLRLCPVAASVRAAGPEYQLVHPDTGQVFPTYGFILVSGTMCLHYSPRIWPRPTEFVPERWVATSEADPLYPTTKYAWRPFEYGPMGCIGQELAMIELKMALLFTVRELEFQTALEEWDRERGIKTEDRPTIFGDPIFPAGVGLGPPTEKLPMRVRRLKR